MGTRSSITAKVSDGSFKTIYCHWDGYPSHHGRILLDHYGDQDKVDSLMALGDLSVLSASTECPAGHTYDTAQRGFCIAYGRDRGESGTEARSGLTAEESLHMLGTDGLDYGYLWDGSKWLFGDYHNRKTAVPSTQLTEEIIAGEDE